MSQPNEQRVVLNAPGMASIVPRKLTYPRDGGTTLALELYDPPAATAARKPAVVFVSGYPDPGFRRVMGCAFRDMGAYVSWAQLLAVSGLVGITYENVDPVADARTVLEFVTANAQSLDLDPERIGIWACSGNAATALSLLATPSLGIRCAALLYGYLMDLPGHSEVASAAGRFGFAAAMAGRPLEDLLPIPTLLVRAGRDAMPGLNLSADRFLAAAAERNLPFRLADHAEGDHGFDLADNGERSLDAIHQVIDHLRRHLG